MGQTDVNASQNVAASSPYTLKLAFQGDAAYTVAEYRPDGAGGWTKSKDIQTDGDSTDAQHDSYEMTAVSVGQAALVRIKANMEAVSSGATVSVTATVTSSGKTSSPVTATGTYTSAPVALSVNVVVTGA